MGKSEKKKMISESLENLPEPILDHVLSYVKELEEKIEDENLNEFIVKLNDKHHDLLTKLASY